MHVITCIWVVLILQVVRASFPICLAIFTCILLGRDFFSFLDTCREPANNHTPSLV